jgi:hypothetical protein
VKHIKSFNESNNEEDLKDFCETHLAYLLDDSNFELNVDDSNFELNVDDYTQGGIYRGQIRLENEKGFYWDDIKDYFIPFLIQLDKIRGHQIKIGDEKLVFVRVGYRDSSEWNKIPFDDLVNDFEISNSLPLSHVVADKNWTKIHIELSDE